MAQINGTAYSAACCPHHLRERTEKASGDEVRRNISEREMYKTQFEKQTFIIQNEMRQCQKSKRVFFLRLGKALNSIKITEWQLSNSIWL